MEKETKKEEEKVEEVKEVKEIPKGYYLAQIPTDYGIVTMKGKEKIHVEELIIKMANALEKAGLMKD